MNRLGTNYDQISYFFFGENKNSHQELFINSTFSALLLLGLHLLPGKSLFSVEALLHPGSFPFAILFSDEALLHPGLFYERKDTSPKIEEPLRKDEGPTKTKS